MKAIIIAMVMSCLLVACGKREDSTPPSFSANDHQETKQVQQQNQSQPQVQQQAQQQDSGTNWKDMAIGAAVGYAASSMLSGNRNQQPEVIYRDREVTRSYNQPSSAYVKPPNSAKSQIAADLVKPQPQSTPKPQITAQQTQKQAVVSPQKPNYSQSNSGYSSVRQSAPSYKSSPSRSYSSPSRSYSSGRR